MRNKNGPFRIAKATLLDPTVSSACLVTTVTQPPEIVRSAPARFLWPPTSQCLVLAYTRLCTKKPEKKTINSLCFFSHLVIKFSFYIHTVMLGEKSSKSGQKAFVDSRIVLKVVRRYCSNCEHVDLAC